jgi:hypothetical protein
MLKVSKMRDAKSKTPENHVVLFELVMSNINNDYYFCLPESIRNLEYDLNKNDIDIETRFNLFYKILFAMCRENTTLRHSIMTTWIHSTIHKELMQFGFETYFNALTKIVDKTSGCRLMLASPFVDNEFLTMNNENARPSIELSHTMLVSFATLPAPIANLPPIYNKTLDDNISFTKVVNPTTINHLWCNNHREEVSKYFMAQNLELTDEPVANDIAIYLIDPTITSAEMRDIIQQCGVLKERNYNLFLFHSTTDHTCQIADIFNEPVTVLPPTFNMSVARRLLERPFRAVFTNVDNAWSEFFRCAKLGYEGVFPLEVCSQSTNRIDFESYGNSLTPMHIDNPNQVMSSTGFIFCPFASSMIRLVDRERLTEFMDEHECALFFMSSSYNCIYEQDSILETNIDCMDFKFAATNYNFEKYLEMVNTCKYFAAYEVNNQVMDAVVAGKTILDINTMQTFQMNDVINKTFLSNHNLSIKQRFETLCNSIGLINYDESEHIKPEDEEEAPPPRRRVASDSEDE